MLGDLLLAAVVAISFAIGALLYRWTHKEVDSVKQKYYSKFLAKAKEFSLVPIGLLGTMQALATKTPYIKTFSIALLVVALAFGSFAIAEKDSKLTIKYTIETVAT